MKKLIVLVALLCPVMISSTAAAAANWVWIYSDDRFTIYVDNNSIRRDYNYSGYVFRAFTKTVYSEAGRNWKIERRRADGSLPRGIYNLSHQVSLEYFKAADGMKYWGSLNTVFYTHDGTTIPEMGYSFDSVPQWELINPDSIGEAEFDAIYARVPN